MPRQSARTFDDHDRCHWPVPGRGPKTRTQAIPRLARGMVVALLGGNLNERGTMLWTILIILLVLWALGAFVFPVAGGLIHLLLVVALIVLLVRLFTGRRVV